MKISLEWLIIFTFILFVACQENIPVTVEEPALKSIYNKVFMVGAALNEQQITGKDTKSLGLALKQFNSITPENILKWENVHPELNRYNFAVVDSFVELGQKNNMFIITFVLCHSL